MGFRFQKRLRIFPGLTLNLSKKGVSTSIGVRGARITRGHGKTRVTVGIPGSGLSHSTVRSNRRAAPVSMRPAGALGVPRWVVLIAIGVALTFLAVMLMKVIG